jgi:hypothetical protein
MVLTSRNNVIAMNRKIIFLVISISLVFIYKEDWILVLYILAAGYILSIAYSVTTSNRVKKTIGLSHAEQGKIWTELKEAYRSSRVKNAKH